MTTYVFFISNLLTQRGMGKQLKFGFVAVLTTLMVLAGSILQVGEPLMAASSVYGNCQSSACTLAIANQIYTQYPEIPRAEQANTTLLSRFIDYHLDAKARPAQYHLDWELSMADYLDTPYSHSPKQSANDTIDNVDQRAMQTLSRQQRHSLVRTLEQLFTQ
ncbi:hypothetical protein IQ260_17555 [Leptolyngbya cf. ectocarpi LEGE 11479]|uniref:Uncharacterized protein n=1 Tax=Leptolyngbya cf. ectocarpi LEGE 11479 TaxID=1828722 RepID=A0A928ZW42_LEPEC|nr:hypothetical protein [Leptolyngbya ectocarpi]MBE9068460.1 hypothetical protein [Leptolyngbya cf. ectocarpi LEGE 11479]